MSMRLLCLRSPVSEVCRLGFAPELGAAARVEMLRPLLMRIKDYAHGRGIALLSDKDVSDYACATWDAAAGGYSRKFIGMEYEQGGEHELYFAGWLHNVRGCIQHRIALYEAGQFGYDTKMRLGCRLLPPWHYVRRNPLVNRVLQLIARALGLHCVDPELQAAMGCEQ